MKLARARAWLAAAVTVLGLTSCSVSGLTVVAPSSATSNTGAGGTADAGGGTAADPPASGHALLRVHDPRRVTGTITGHCTFRDHGQLPDPRCTPGAVDPNVTQGNLRSTICHPGYTKTVRPPASVTDRFKYEVAYPAYGLPRDTRAELDHDIPLELGGSNDASNLWPEAGPMPNPKDHVETALHNAVCSGKVALAAAQAAIAANWITAEAKLGL